MSNEPHATTGSLLQRDVAFGPLLSARLKPDPSDPRLNNMLVQLDPTLRAIWRQAVGNAVVSVLPISFISSQ
jgi:hypothetical protein